MYVTIEFSSRSWRMLTADAHWLPRPNLHMAFCHWAGGLSITLLCNSSNSSTPAARSQKECRREWLLESHADEHHRKRVGSKSYCAP